MRVTSLFFASYRELAGTGELEVELPAGATVSDLVARVRAGRPRLADLPEEPVVAVNREYAALDIHLEDGDEVAFIPPVAGG
ncbi:MAG: molybdopterin converting factor subunit 1 [Gemmatimonadetes bacterium]|nr:molybdopterin converting factor subunit 1 [Gemmatimonadota bacterium]